MKQFIYLDTDIVNSIIAQKDKGLVLETASEHEDTSGDERGKTGSLTFNRKWRDMEVCASTGRIKWNWRSIVQ